jgi:hypothetical protein
MVGEFDNINLMSPFLYRIRFVPKFNAHLRQNLIYEKRKLVTAFYFFTL